MSRKIRRVFDFHGAFVKKADAVEREEETPNSFILPIWVRGQRRYAVVSRLDGRKPRRRR